MSVLCRKERKWKTVENALCLSHITLLNDTTSSFINSFHIRFMDWLLIISDYIRHFFLQSSFKVGCCHFNM